MNPVLARWNRLSPGEAEKKILACCGSVSWARAVAAQRPIEDEPCLLAISDGIWRRLHASDWLEAFSQHPRIGERKAPRTASARAGAWSAQEQEYLSTATTSAQEALEEGNREYEQRFGRIFIVCATGKSVEQILDILRRRLHNDETTELNEGAEEQRKIINLRLNKWLAS